MEISISSDEWLQIIDTVEQFPSRIIQMYNTISLNCNNKFWAIFSLLILQLNANFDVECTNFNVPGSNDADNNFKDTHTIKMDLPKSGLPVHDLNGIIKKSQQFIIYFNLILNIVVF